MLLTNSLEYKQGLVDFIPNEQLRITPLLSLSQEENNNNNNNNFWILTWFFFLQLLQLKHKKENMCLQLEKFGFILGCKITLSLSLWQYMKFPQDWYCL